MRLATAAAKYRTRMGHVSSDAIFPSTDVHHDESNLPDPVTTYGAAKAAAETGILAVHPKAHDRPDITCHRARAVRVREGRARTRHRHARRRPVHRRHSLPRPRH
ncbi:sugar nucleotide-binding protein [Streptomyces vinaceus]|uniref:sugar nucleotide-binding protein n=1 Tax=Streptomyces vinaceus TaxID=1960 RepID=UPI0036B3CFD4